MNKSLQINSILKLMKVENKNNDFEVKQFHDEF